MKRFIPYEFGFSSHALKSFDEDDKKIKKLDRLLKLESADEVTKICKHYISNFIPDPIGNENEYWIISCYPSTDNSPVRVSIWFPEVFNIHEGGQYYNRDTKLWCMVFIHSDHLDKRTKAEVLKNTKGLEFHPEYRFVTGIEGQLAAFMPIDSYFTFVNDERIFEGIRAHNYELTLKGRSPFKKGHNYSFVRHLFYN